jgi:hypothetical protein
MPNYRAVYKSDHLGVIDLEELVEQNKPLIFTIREVRQEIGATVAGAKGDFNIAYFVEPIKPLVLNATNAGTVRKLGRFGTDVDTWKNLRVELYIDATVKMKGQVVGGVRIKQVAPAPVTPVSDSKAIAAINSAQTIADLSSAWGTLTADEKKLPTVIAAKDAAKLKLTNANQ